MSEDEYRRSSISFALPKESESVGPSGKGEVAAKPKAKKGRSLTERLGLRRNRRNSSSDIEDEASEPSVQPQPPQPVTERPKGCLRRPSGDEDMAFMERTKQQAMSPRVIEETVKESLRNAKMEAALSGRRSATEDDTDHVYESNYNSHTRS